MRFLLINPWIYDFAAYNLWSKPLGLLKVAEFLSQFDVELKQIDCTDSYKARRFNSGNYTKTHIEKPPLLKGIPRRYSRYGIRIDSFISRVKSLMPFDAVFITSIMTYWYPGVKKAFELLKEISPDTAIILGGIYATLYTEHAKNTIKPDSVHKGSINNNIPLLSGLKKKGNTVPYYKSGLYKTLSFAPLLTSHGCPYNCSYCASGLLNENYSQRPVEDIYREIVDLYGMGIVDFAFYDDALLFNPDIHIKMLLKKIIKSGINLRLHSPNGLHARYIDNELADLMKNAGFRTIRLSLETIDEDRQVMSGNKIRTKEFKEAVDYLKKNGFTKNEIGAYLMYGLPGQTISEVKEGVRFLKSLGVRIHLTEFSTIPGTESFKYLVSKGVITQDIDPILTNNTVFSYLFSDYNFSELEDLKLDVKLYNSV